MNQVATINPKPSLIADMAARYNMEPATFRDTIRATVVPKNATNEEFAAFLMVAKHYSLNPITKEIYAFPKQGGGIQPIVSVDGWANLINSHPQCDGIEFEDHISGENLTSITCRIYRKDRSRPTSATEYMAECRRDTSTWKQWPRRMLRHKALIQAARYAFGFAGIVDPDEAERFTVTPARVVQQKDDPPAPPAAPQIAAPPVQPAQTEQEVIPPAPAATSKVAPVPAEDPEAFVKFVSVELMAAKSGDELNAAWDRYVTPAEKELFPTDQDDLMSVFRKREAELS